MTTPRDYWPRWAETLRRFQLTDIAASLLEAGSPLALLGAQALYFSRGFFNSDQLSALAATLENPAKLSKAGVALVLSSFDTHNARNIRQEAGNAIAYGLDRDAALRAVTLEPARVWGVTPMPRSSTLKPRPSSRSRSARPTTARRRSMGRTR